MHALISALLVAAAVTDPRATVHVANPHRFTLSLHRVLDDASELVRELGSGSEYALDLPIGAYWIDVRADDAAWRLPLPLVRRALRPDVLRIEVEEAPPAEPGWCWIPAGPFLRGDEIGVGQEDERPARIAHLPGFWMKRDEVTTAEYARFLDAQDAVDPRWLNLASVKCGIRRDPGTGRYTPLDPAMPVVTVSWYGATAWCVWLTRTTGVTHRLPTEAEWEKAARGPESFVFAYGNIYRTAGANQESGRLLPVGGSGPNGFGVRDLTGNAFEWVDDVYDRDALGGERPMPLAAADRDGLPRHRVLRGGSFVLDGMYLRNSFRMHQGPSVQADDFGFRVVREAHVSKGDHR